MASFADTWMFEREPFEVWSHWFVKDTGFDPSLWFLAEAGDELAGIALTRVSENEPDLGWVRILGVLPEFRQRGLATGSPPAHVRGVRAGVGSPASASASTPRTRRALFASTSAPGCTFPGRI